VLTHDARRHPEDDVLMPFDQLTEGGGVPGPAASYQRRVGILRRDLPRKRRGRMHRSVVPGVEERKTDTEPETAGSRTGLHET